MTNTFQASYDQEMDHAKARLARTDKLGRPMAVYPKARPCQFCGTPFHPHRFDQLCCSGKCTKAKTNLEMKRGRMIYAYAMNWRKQRNTKAQRQAGAKNLAALCRELDRMADEDKACGRPLPEGYVDWKGE